MSNITTHQHGAIVAQSEEDVIRVLQNSLYPGAQIGSVQLVLDYCRAAKLDPMQKPVHLVPMWDSKSGSMRDVVMPGVNLHRTNATRTNRLMGVSEPEFGPMIDEKIGGVQVSYPEWCRVTVKRLMDNGAVAEFTALEYWIENYAVKGGKEKSVAPNAMWQRRVRGQLAKCTEAQALRKAFPESCAAPTAEEMEGKSIHQEIDITPKSNASAITQDWVAVAAACETVEDVNAVWQSGLQEIKAANDMGLYNAFKAAIAARGNELKAAASAQQKPPQTGTINADTGEIDFGDNSDFLAGMDRVEAAQ